MKYCVWSAFELCGTADHELRAENELRRRERESRRAQSRRAQRASRNMMKRKSTSLGDDSDDSDYSDSDEDFIKAEWKHSSKKVRIDGRWTAPVKARAKRKTGASTTKENATTRTRHSDNKASNSARDARSGSKARGRAKPSTQNSDNDTDDSDADAENDVPDDHNHGNEAISRPVFSSVESLLHDDDSEASDREGLNELAGLESRDGEAEGFPTSRGERWRDDNLSSASDCSVEDEGDESDQGEEEEDGNEDDASYGGSSDVGMQRCL